MTDTPDLTNIRDQIALLCYSLIADLIWQGPKNKGLHAQLRDKAGKSMPA